VTVEICRVEHVDAFWPQLAEGFRKSCRKTGNTITAGWLWQLCRSGQAILLIAFEDTVIQGAAIVQFEDRGRTLRGLGLCGSEIKKWWPEMTEAVRALAKDGDAVRYVDSGRPGMKALYPGSRIIETTFEVAL